MRAGGGEGGDDTVVGVGRRGAEAGHEAREPSGGEGTAETAQAGGPGEPRRFWSMKNPPR